jgi:hypothetical protein
VTTDAPEQAAPAPSPGGAVRQPAIRRSGVRALWEGPVGYCLRVYLVFRAGLFALGLIVAGVLPHNGDVGVPGWPAPPPVGWSTAVTAWETADALWYLRIASQGYSLDDGSGAFFPLYPLLIRGVGILTGGHWLLAAYLVSNLALVVALVLLYRLTEREFSTSMARKAVLYLCAFPTGFFLFAPYSESLFLALGIGTLYAARTGRWGYAALLGLLAALSRSPGVVLAVPLAIEALLQARAVTGPLQARLKTLAAGAGACAATVCGLLLYLGYWQVQAGDWRRPIDLQRSGWGKESAWPWETLWAGAKVAVQFPGSNPGGYFLVDLLMVLLVMAAGVWVALRARATYAVYVWAGVLFPLFLMWPGRPLLSLPRIYLVLFPTVWALARLAERFRAHDAVLVASAVSMGILAAMFASANPLF